jgi:hypothetical protein
MKGKGMSDTRLRTRSAVHDEVTRWFFDDYLPTWVGVGASTITRGPEFILDYWSAPLYFSTEQGGGYLLSASDVVGFLQQLHSRLRAEGYAKTAVPDRKVTVYHDFGAAIDVIWSRCRADDSEIERLAAHFELARGYAGWRIVGVQTAATDADSLAAHGNLIATL